MNPTGILETAKATNPLLGLQKFGQSIWLDYIRRSLISTGELQRLIDQDGLRGVTSNPSIFEKAITGSTDYYARLKELASRSDLDAKGIYEQLAIRDIQDATDIFRPVYDTTKRRDGYVSLEVSPYLANKGPETLEEARRLWKSVGRDNVMIKVPGTAAGIPVFQQLIGEGINVNVTLLFAQDVYESVAEAYIAGLEELAKRGGDVSRVASVASFFISRIDTLIDAQIADRLKTAKPADQPLLRSLQGKIAIANGETRLPELQANLQRASLAGAGKCGAQTQRVLWASTSTKNPAYRDVLYVEELIGPDTVDTIPPATYDAFRDHGHPRASLEENLDEAAQPWKISSRFGISMKAATDKLTEDGVRAFRRSL